MRSRRQTGIIIFVLCVIAAIVFVGYLFLNSQDKEYVLQDYTTSSTFRRTIQDTVELSRVVAVRRQSVIAAPETGTATRVELENAREAVDEALLAVQNHDAQVEINRELHEITKEEDLDNLAYIRQNIADLEQRLADTRVKAALTGRVVSIMPRSAIGETIQAQTTIMEIADTRDPLIQTDIEEQYVNLLSLGQTATVSFAGEQFTGRIERIGAQAQIPSGGGIPTVALDIGLEQKGVDVIPGSSAVIEVIIGEIQNALVLPRGPFLTTGNRRYLYRVNGKTAQRVAVTFGAVTENLVQINSGIQEGDKIITSSYQNFIDQEKITLGGTQ